MFDFLLLTGSSTASPLIPESEIRAFFAGGLKKASKVLFAVDIMLRNLMLNVWNEYEHLPSNNAHAYMHAALDDITI